MTPEHNATPNKPPWGLLPEDIIASKRKQWRQPGKLKRLLKDESAFPLHISLKPPRGNAALVDIRHFQTFVSSWKAFSADENRRAGEVYWENRRFRALAEQSIPTKLVLPDVGAFASLLGEHETRELNAWQSQITHLLNALDPLWQSEAPAAQQKKSALFSALIDHLETLNKFDRSDLGLLVKLIPQLTQGMGNGSYLRALPVIFVDTKFIENHLRMIESIVAALIDEAVKDMGLLNWLDCQGKPKDWLLIKPLCEQTQAALGGIPLLRLSSETLRKFALPARNILIIENEQSCLALNHMTDTIAIAGGGKNVAWMTATWLAAKRVGYWGDIDSEGLAILSDARSKLSTITSLMMDARTVENYQERMVAEPDSVAKEPIALTESELDLLRSLRSKKYVNTRLEQERLPMDYVIKTINAWIR